MPALEEELKEEERKSNNSRRWMVHVHSYSTGTDPEMGHQHRIMSVSCPAKITKRRLHVHSLPGRTTFTGTNAVELHWHAYEIITDFEVEMPDGTHVHYFSGLTSVDAGHRHSFSGSTNLGPDIYSETADVSNNNNKYKNCNRPEEYAEAEEAD